jgi:hypothetical protein
MEIREAVCEGEKYQGTNICGKGEWKGSIKGAPGVGDGLRKERRDDQKKSDTWQLGSWFEVSKDQMGHLTWRR